MSDTKAFDIEVVQHSTGSYRIEASTKSEAIDTALEFARDGALDHERHVNSATEVDDKRHD